MTGRILLFATQKWPSAARYAGGFHAAGCNVYALCPDGAPVCVSRYVSGTSRYNPLAPLSALRGAIAAWAPDVIVACDDRAVTHLLRLYRAEKEKSGETAPVAALIARSLGAPENYGRVISRHGSLQEMQTLDVRAPDTLPVNDESELAERLAAIGLPAVLKTDGSWGGEGVAIVLTREEAFAAYRRLSRPPSRLRSLVRSVRRRDPHYLVAALKPRTAPICIQRFVAGAQAASAFAAHDGKVVAMFHYDVLVSNGTNGPPAIIRRVDRPEMDRAVEAVAAQFGLSGLHGLDFIRDPEDAVHLIEINPRATQGGTLPFGAGRDLPSALAEALFAKPAGRRPALENDVVSFFPRSVQNGAALALAEHAHLDVPWDDLDVLQMISGARRAKRPATIRIEANRALRTLRAFFSAVGGRHKTRRRNRFPVA
jgi:hypothetical protein